MPKQTKQGFLNSLPAIIIFCALLVIILTLIIHFSRHQGIQINEIMISNQRSYPGIEANYPDWVELYNPLDREINLKGYFLSDDHKSIRKWEIPDIAIQRKGYLVLESGNDPEKYFNFSLSNNDRYVILSKPDGSIVSSVTIKKTGPDKSLVRDSIGWSETDVSTPGFPNDENGYLLYMQQLSSSDYRLRINEYSPANNTRIIDEFGETPDWIEIYNYGNSAVNLKGFGLSDRLDDLIKWSFPTLTIQPGEYQVVFASGKNIKKNTGLPHTNFRLNNKKDRIFLSDPSGMIIDSTQYRDFPDNAESTGIFDNQWLYFRKSSAGKANGMGYLDCTDKIRFSEKPGFYSGSLTLTIEGSDAVHYTIDGTDPGPSSPLYKKPLQIDKTTVVKARVYKKDALPGKLVFGTYFIGEPHTVPVFSISLAPDLLFSKDIGMYEMGPNPGKDFPYYTANFWKKWEYAAQVEMFSDEGEQQFDISGGLRIFGAFSRALPQKSFVVKFRNEYGHPRLKYQLFPDKEIYSFESFVLRAGGQDSQRTKLRDITTSKLSLQMGLESQTGYPVVLYLNGKYWGVYNIREKIEDAYLAGNTGRPDKTGFNLIQANMTVLAGKYDDYGEVIKYVAHHDISKDEHYQWVCDHVDVVNYADYHVVQVYSGNADAGNIRCWKGDAPGDKWRWIVFDTDHGFYSPAYLTLEHWLDPNGRGHNKYFSTLLITRLLRNAEYRELFIARFIYHLDHILSSENVIRLIREEADMLRPEMPAQVKRWGLKIDSSWESQVDDLINFAEKRDEYVLKDVMRHFKLKVSDLDKYRNSKYYGKL